LAVLSDRKKCKFSGYLVKPTMAQYDEHLSETCWLPV